MSCTRRYKTEYNKKHKVNYTKCRLNKQCAQNSENTSDCNAECNHLNLTPPLACDTDIIQTDFRRASSLNAPYPRGGGIIIQKYILFR